MAVICIISEVAPVAQLDRAIASGAIGREFESLRAHQFPANSRCRQHLALLKAICVTQRYNQRDPNEYILRL